MSISAQTIHVFEVWKKNGGSQNFFQKSAVVTDLYRNVYVAGTTMNGNGDYDVLVAKYDKFGIKIWQDQYGGSVSGTAQSFPYRNPGAPSFFRNGSTTNGGNLNFDGFITRFITSDLLTSRDEEGEGIQGDFILYPNPGFDQFRVSTNSTDKLFKLEMFDLQGRRVSSIDHYFADELVSTSFLPSGLYLVCLTNEGGKTITLKFVKQ